MQTLARKVPSEPFKRDQDGDGDGDGDAVAAQLRDHLITGAD
ncbi:MAG: hypothetical protein RBG13Loki_0421, partial [Promethearchaeota archaeon CR_4]